MIGKPTQSKVLLKGFVKQTEYECGRYIARRLQFADGSHDVIRINPVCPGMPAAEINDSADPVIVFESLILPYTELDTFSEYLKELNEWIKYFKKIFFDDEKAGS